MDTKFFKRRRRALLSKASAALLALRLGLRHASRLFKPLGGGGGQDPPAVAAEGWGVTRRTSMSDTSEQLAGRPGKGSGRALAEGGCSPQRATDEGAAKQPRLHRCCLVYVSALQPRQTLRLARLVARVQAQRASLKQPSLMSPCRRK